jgi:hypothetical protein
VVAAGPPQGEDCRSATLLGSFPAPAKLLEKSVKLPAVLIKVAEATVQIVLVEPEDPVAVGQKVVVDEAQKT